MKLKVPKDVEEFATRLANLRASRRRRKAKMKGVHRPGRTSLSPAQRKEVLKKTGKRCHICGGTIEGPWQADHVLAHSTGGVHAADNYLPAHSLCNKYRWDYSAKEFQEILKLGVWIRTKIEKLTPIGRSAGEMYLAHERSRERRRKR